MKRPVAAVLALLSVLGPLACGDDGGDSGASGRSVERYCELSKELEAVEDTTDVAETEPEMAAAMAKFLGDHDDLIDDLRAAAPEEISSELDKAFEALEKMGEGDFAAMDAVDTEKIDNFNAENCQ